MTLILPIDIREYPRRRLGPSRGYTIDIETTVPEAMKTLERLTH
jgi:hypothetical protein